MAGTAAPGPSVVQMRTRDGEADNRAPSSHPTCTARKMLFSPLPSPLWIAWPKKQHCRTSSSLQMADPASLRIGLAVLEAHLHSSASPTTSMARAELAHHRSLRRHRRALRRHPSTRCRPSRRYAVDTLGTYTTTTTSATTIASRTCIAGPFRRLRWDQRLPWRR